MKYKCIKEFYVDKYDGDGFLLYDEYCIIPVGSVWIVDESNTRIVGGSETIRLELETNENKYQWLEILEDTLNEHFEALNKTDI